MFRRYSREISVAGVIAVVCLFLAAVVPGFFTIANLRDLLLSNLPVLIIALGMTMVILTREIDISVGSQFAICGVLCAALAKTGMPTAAAGLAACIAGGLLGAINGVLVAYAGIPSIVVTLATMVALRDGLRWITQGAWIQDLPPSFQWFGASQRASEIGVILATIVLVVAVDWILRNVAAGRAVYATGSDRNVAELTGIHTARVLLTVFVLTGMLTGLAAFANSIRFNQVPSNAGLGLELKAIAAVVVGGTAITGGRGTVIGTVLGVILLGVIGPALIFLGVSAYWERAIQGAIILAAVTSDAVRFHTTRQVGRLARTAA